MNLKFGNRSILLTLLEHFIGLSLLAVLKFEFI